MPDVALQKYIEDRSVPEPNTGCWLWERSLGGPGYGNARIYGQQSYAHRVSWIAYFGPIPNGMYVCHKCDVKACVNPEHFFLGTNRDNMLDMFSKGRGNRATGDRHGSRTKPEQILRGERNGKSKLTTAQVMSVRMLIALGASQRDIGGWFGVSKPCISHIALGLNRAHG